MAIEELDVIKEIKAAEAQAKMLITAAEQKKIEAVEQAQVKAKVEIEGLRERLQREFNEALAKAEIEAKNLFSQIVEDAKKQAQVLENIPEQRLHQAVAMLMRRVLEKWQ